MSDSQQFVTKIIKRPFIPFWEVLQPTVDINTCVVVKGRVPRFANQFVFNFIVGQEISTFARNSEDIALQFNPRFEGEGLVLNNSRIANHWGFEEKIRKEFPFARNKWFEVKFVVKESYIKIFIDGNDFGLYLHRIPFQFIGIFSIEGDVEVDSVVFARDVVNQITEQRVKSQMITNGNINEEKSLKVMSEPEIRQQIDHNLNIYTSNHSVVDNMVLSQKTIYNPPLPFCEPVYNSLKSGMTVTVNGQTTEDPKQFTVRLQCPPSSTTDTPDVAISLTIDFDSKQIRRKCRIDGQWVKEEEESLFFPFKRSGSKQYFELKIEINENRFIITFNGIHFAEYVSRIGDYSRSHLLEIDGHIHLIYVKFDASLVDSL